MTVTLKLTLAGVACSISSLMFAQKTERQIEKHLNDKYSSIGLTKDDFSDFIIENEHKSEKFNVSYAYAHQRYEGIEIYNAINSFVLTEDTIIMAANRFQSDLAKRVNTTSPSLSQSDAIISAANQLGLTSSQDFQMNQLIGNNGTTIFLAPSISNNEIPIELCFDVNGKDIRLAWNLSIQTKKDAHWWSVRVDAVTGEILSQNDWYTSCTFEGNCSDHAEKHTTAPQPESGFSTLMMPPPPSTDQYNVFAVPVESPNHGPRSLVVGPSDPVASPFGWHDDDGVDGPEYTITRGNNVYATEDTNDDDLPGYAPDGGPSLNFDFPLNLNQAGTGFWDPAITNLFYFNNMMHDVWYQYGFDEASGNFQENNYGNGGLQSDMVNADAQDGSGTNNANFGTPPDGQNPRMQMYLWSSNGSPKLVQINSPTGLAGLLASTSATIGPGIPATPVTADFALFDDGTGDELDACETAINGASLVGKIVIVRRGGTCNFADKIFAAQNEGAVGVIVVNNTSGGLIAMGGTDPGITIPAVMITQFNGQAIINALESGTTVNGSIGDFGPFDFDSDFDNGIIAHEYGHGISNRLTGGGSASGCLGNAEQMGEGWSDWFALVMSMEPGDLGTDARGIGTYASGQPTSGGGIRPAPYSTDWSVNNYTYGITNNDNSISQPHGIGFIWCTMLWDLTWALIDEYGYDPDLYNGTGGNNIAMQLIMDGMKNQPCGPGFVDGRDAILAADFTLFGGTHQCIIWEVFANRGLGYSADQGSADSRLDQIQAFDLPPALDHVTTTTVSCTDYVWAENGQTYTTSGTYYTTITPNSGCDSIATLNLTVNNSINSVVSYNGPTTLVSTVNNVNYQWINCAGDDFDVVGATNQSFSPTENGLYAVIAYQGTCIDTSVCIFVNQVSLDDFNLAESLSVSPNPTNGEITVNLGNTTYTSVEARIVNAIGQVVSEKSFENVDSFLLNIDGAPGIYFVTIEADGNSAITKIIKD